MAGSWRQSGRRSIRTRNLAKTTAIAWASFAVSVAYADPPAFTSSPPLSVDEDQLYAYDIVAQDLDGDALTITAPTRPAWLTLVDNGDGTATLSGTPAQADVGPHNVTVEVSDGIEPPVPQNFVLTVNNVNDPPTASPDGYQTNEGTTLSVSAASGVLTNDADPDGDDLDAVIQDSVNNGVLNLDAQTGAFTYTPDPGFFGQDTFSYVARDTVGADSNEVTVTIDVTFVNDPPVGVPDAYTTEEDSPSPLIVSAPGILQNDTDPEDGSPGTAVLAGNVSNGTLNAFPGTGAFTYTPNPDFSGTDTFTYQARDSGNLLSGETVVTITVDPVNDPPAANPDNYETNEDTTLSINAAGGVLGNDNDPDSVLSAELINDVGAGTLTLNPDGSFTYTPDPDFAGTDTFTYQARDDGNLLSAETTVTVTVSPVNDPPSGSVPDHSVTENEPFTYDVSPFFSDLEGDTPITFGFVGLPDWASGSADGVISGQPPIESGVGDHAVEVTAVDALGAQSPPDPFLLKVNMAGRADLTLNVNAAPGPAVINQPVDWHFVVGNQTAVPVSNIAVDATFSGEVPFTLTDTANCTVTPQGAETDISCAATMSGPTQTVTVTGTSSQAGDVLTSATVRITDFTPVEQNPGDDSASGALNVAQRLSTAPALKITSNENQRNRAGDLNSDGYLDLVVATGSSQSTLIYPNVIDPGDVNGIRRTLAVQPLSLGDQGPGADVAVADLNGDGALDIVTANRMQASRVLMNLNAGDGTFAFAAPLTLGPGTDVSSAVDVADVNGDLLIDLVFGNAGPNRLFLNQGGGVFSDIELPGNAETVDVLLVDLLGGDGLPELVVANADGNSEVYRNVDGSFEKELDLTTGPATSIAAGDFDGNGITDLVFGRESADFIYLNTSGGGTGGFFPAGTLGASPTVDMLTADLDADLDMDIISINSTGGHQIFLNSGNGQFTLHPEIFSSAGPFSAVAGLFSVDERIDVAVTGADGSDLFFNDGRGNLGPGDTLPPVIQRLGAGTVSLELGDSYTDAGATAVDDIDGDLTAQITVDDPVNTAVLGSYTIRYNVTDSSGNAAAVVTRRVEVGAQPPAGGGGGGGASPWFLALLLGLTCISRLPISGARARRME